MKARLLVGLVALGALGAAGAEEQGGPAGGGQAPPPPEVSFVEIQERDLPFSHEFLGVVQASRMIEVRARLRGYVAERLFEEGAFVEEGQLLYRIERESFVADVEIAKARVDEAKARVTLAQRELERQVALVSSGAVAQSDLDKANAEADVAKASVQLAESELAKSELELSYTQIHAPLSGYIGKTQRDVGSFVDDGDKGLLTEITRLDPIYVSFAVSEREFLASRTAFESQSVERPQRPKFSVMIADGSVINGGELNFEDPQFDPMMGTIQLRVQFDNPGSRLRPGQFVKVHAEGLVRPDSIVVPQRAVAQTAMGSAVFVIGEGNVLEYRPVTVDSWTGDDWLVTDGLKVGERVMVDGIMKAQPGSPVTPVPLEAGS